MVQASLCVVLIVLVAAAVTRRQAEVANSIALVFVTISALVVSLGGGFVALALLVAGGATIPRILTLLRDSRDTPFKARVDRSRWRVNVVTLVVYASLGALAALVGLRAVWRSTWPEPTTGEPRAFVEVRSSELATHVVSDLVVPLGVVALLLLAALITVARAASDRGGVSKDG
jgi:NADH:ubiquinone oxidoreductase subunit 6 (subunit J)